MVSGGCKWTCSYVARIVPLGLLWSTAAPWLWSPVAPSARDARRAHCPLALVICCSGPWLWSPVAPSARDARRAHCPLALVTCCTPCSGHPLPPLLWSPQAVAPPLALLTNPCSGYLFHNCRCTCFGCPAPGSLSFLLECFLSKIKNVFPNAKVLCVLD